MLPFLIISILLLVSSSNADSNSAEHGIKPGIRGTNCTCGQANKNSGRIVNGKETFANEYPLIAGIRTQSDPEIFCGGTIITTYHVLTAAHCIDELDDNRVAVVVGAHDVSNYVKRPRKSIVINVKQSIMHEKYNLAEEYEMDIALLVLEKKVPLSRYVSPACFPGPTAIPMIGKQVKVIGWGTLWSGGPGAKTLKKVNLNVIKLNHCANHFGGIDLVKKTQFCTYREARDSCQGDSGGPVLWLDPETNRFTVMGVVSYGDECGQKDIPGVNTDVQSFRSWILKKVSETVPKAQTCQKV